MSVSWETAWCWAGTCCLQASIGRSDLPGGDYDTLLESIRRELLSLPDATMVLPGTGKPTTIRRSGPATHSSPVITAEGARSR